jgi:hypothetical protein
MFRFTFKLRAQNKSFAMRLGVLCLLTLAIAAIALAKEKDDKNKEVGTVIGIDLGTTYSW